MTAPDPAAVHRALAALLHEIIDGADPKAGWILNPEDPGMLRSLDKLSAAAASGTRPGGGSSIAAHVDHLRYGLELMNRWSRGEDPWADADWAASWRRVKVSETEWASLRARLQAEARSWLQAVREPRALDDAELTGLLASAAHLAYHLGAIRQMDRSTGGPAARVRE
ncbi:MAG TPA: DinB family protein [Candidatus Eisenbacteria bacterium]|jgi:hypothetical protein